MSLIWPADYAQCREGFIQAAERCGAARQTKASRHPSPEGLSLATDVARLGPSRADHLIIVTSGVHGVEGFLGSVIQAQALAELAHDGLPNGVSLAMIHAVNPWGLAHRRRVDEDNVDVNRNFLEPDAELPPTHPGYASLDALINPSQGVRRADEWRFKLGALSRIVRARGTRELAAAIANGQRTHPRGLFFGGTTAGESSLRLQDLLREMTSDAASVTHLDIHSGLGRSGVPILIGSSNVGTSARVAQTVERHYQHRYIADDAPGNAYDARGTLSRWYRREAGDTPYRYLCVEIGTVSPLRVLSALRRENHAHHYLDPASRHAAEAKRQLCEAFVPSSTRWRQRSVSAGLDIVKRACALAGVAD